MIYYTEAARETAQEHIHNLYVRLGELKPTDNFTLQDISETLYYLRVLADAIKSETKSESRKAERRNNE